MSYFFIVGTAFGVGLSGAVMPGPMLTMVIKEVPVLGWWAGLVVCAGHAAVEIAVVAALLLGLGRWMSLTAVQGLIGVVGGLVLLWLGYGMLRFKAPSNDAAVSTDEAGARPAIRQNEKRSAIQTLKVGARGGLVSVTNPYWVLWWSGVGAQFVASSAKRGLPGITAFYAGHVMSDILWFSFVSFALSAGRAVIAPRAYSRLIAVCGAFLVFLAATFLTRGIGQLA